MLKRSICIAICLAAAAGCSKKKNEGGGTAKPTDGSGSGTAPTGGVVKIDGSSTVFPINQAVGEEFHNAGKGDVVVGQSGTGGGLQKFCRGELDVTGASRPIKNSEADACKAAGVEFIELPIAYDGLAVVVSKKNTWVDHLTVAELATMWSPDSQGKITKWKQIRPSFPDKELKLFGAGTDSGTFDYFTAAINGKEKASRGDYTSSEDDNVLVQGVAGAEGGLAYFGLAYYVENQDSLKIVPIEDGNDDNGKGPITPSEQTVRDGTYQPLSRPLFVYISVKAMERPVVQAFAAFYVDNAGKLAKEVGYVPLPDKVIELTRGRLSAKKTGSVFAGGSQVGMTLEKLLETEGGAPAPEAPPAGSGSASGSATK